MCSSGHSLAPCLCSLGSSSSSSGPGHPLLFTALSIIIYLLTDPDPSEFGEVETNNGNQLMLQRLYNLCKKKLSLQAKMS